MDQHGPTFLKQASFHGSVYGQVKSTSALISRQTHSAIPIDGFFGVQWACAMAVQGLAVGAVVYALENLTERGAHRPQSKVDGAEWTKTKRKPARQIEW
eukprot:s240_g2.t1